MGILDTLAAPNTAATAAAATTAAKPERTPSQIWGNIGVNLPGAGEDGKDLFISLPMGLPLDDMKPVKISGTNKHSIQLKQVKNALLEELQQLGASLEPGERRIVPLQVEIYRVAQPEQAGSVANNPLIAALFGTLQGK